MKEQSMNYCCDCDWAAKKGLFFKRWYCTNPEKNEGFSSHIFHPVTCMPVIKTPIDCDTARFVGKEGGVEQLAVNLKHPCPNYKGQLRGHPAIPPMKNHLPCPPRPEWVAKAMEEHDAAYAAYMDNILDDVFVSISENGKESPRINGVPMENFVTRLHQKAKELQAENRQLRFLITEIREFLIGGAIPGKVHLKQEYIREIYTIASEEDEKRRNEK